MLNSKDSDSLFALLLQNASEIDQVCEDLKMIFKSLGVILSDENRLSSYELHSSGLIQALLHCLTGVRWDI